jgi:hypothetical protein
MARRILSDVFELAICGGFITFVWLMADWGASW